ncbi:MAG TPA: ribbon-helix-helix protein, CopG family [Thermoleophilaceae bacterium]|nr:ribbon-helix-helix protein, CopG family [Thermoleophilaceae bacterium]
MGELNRRVHVLLDDDRLERLRQRAAATGSSVGAVVREAIDNELARDDRAPALAALKSFLAAPPLPVGRPDELKRELQEAWDEEIGID